MTIIRVSLLSIALFVITLLVTPFLVDGYSVYAQSNSTPAVACVDEAFLFENPSTHNLIVDAPRWCDQCPPYSELRDEVNGCNVPPVNFIQKINSSMKSGTTPLQMEDINKVQWCRACAANPDTALLTPAPGSGGSGSPSPAQGGGGYSSDGPNDFSKLKNPLGDSSGVGSLTDFVARILNIVVMIGVPILVLAFMWVGFNYVRAQGNPTKITENHKSLLAVIIGGALLLGASKLASAIKDTVEQIGTGGI